LAATNAGYFFFGEFFLGRFVFPIGPNGDGFIAHFTFNGDPFGFHGRFPVYEIGMCLDRVVLKHFLLHRTQMKTPKAISLKGQTDKETAWLIPGQGVFLFEATDPTACSFMIQNKDQTDGLLVQWDPVSIRVKRASNGDLYADPKNTKGLTTKNGAYYWFSLDAQNQQIYAGVGEVRLETCVYRYQVPFTTDDERKANKKFLESLTSIVSLNINCVAPLRLLRDPVTASIPLLVKPTADLTMDAIATQLHMPHANLCATSQKLYSCMSGPLFRLDMDDFPTFSKAIERSINSPDGWCYKRLQDKSREFNKDKPNLEETYLRITLGQNNGESPGVPYVMEIWPSGHYSPIHNHAGAEAIIRVLYGDIQVSMFPFLSGDSVEPFAVQEFTKDDVTWISPTLNQTHQLKNIHTDRTCITIQCYMYDDNDVVHYDYFDYIDDKGQILQYEPDSDMDFVVFKARMKQEWEEAEFKRVAQEELTAAIQKKERGLFGCFSP
jgi:hypothetical protein